MFLPGQQLVERIELHELQSGLREDFRARHFGERAIQCAARARIAIMIRLAEHLLLFVQQDKINAPRIRAD